MASFSGAKSPSLHPLTRGCKEGTTEKASHRLKKEGETEILTPLTGGGGQTTAGKFRLVVSETKLSVAIDIETSGLDPHTGRRLLQDHHLACLTEVSGLQSIEVNPAGDQLTIGIASIPVDSLGGGSVVTGFLPTQFQSPDQTPLTVIDL